jgi:hypothetical protein
MSSYAMGLSPKGRKKNLKYAAKAVKQALLQAHLDGRQVTISVDAPLEDVSEVRGDLDWPHMPQMAPTGEKTITIHISSDTLFPPGDE